MFLSASEIAALSGLTEKHVKRMILKGRWFGVSLEIQDGCIAFHCLPESIRNKFLAKDQIDWVERLHAHEKEYERAENA